MSVIIPVRLSLPFCICCLIISRTLSMTFCCSAGVIALNWSSVMPSWPSISACRRCAGVMLAYSRNFCAAVSGLGARPAAALPDVDGLTDVGEGVAKPLGNETDITNSELGSGAEQGACHAVKVWKVLICNDLCPHHARQQLPDGTKTGKNCRQSGAAAACGHPFTNTASPHHQSCR